MSRAAHQRARGRIRREQEAWLFAAVFIVILVAGLVALIYTDGLSVPPDVVQALILGALTLCILTPPAVRRFFWHLLANRVSVARPRRLADPYVIDGDTIDDRSTGIRYRLANIDAPETGDNAKCFKENERGEAAKWAAIRLVRAAKTVEVRQTWRIDRYGRRVAFVLVDGEDLGRTLIAQGFARPWLGQRYRWCGKNGGLALIARAGRRAHNCQTCAAWTND